MGPVILMGTARAVLQGSSFVVSSYLYTKPVAKAVLNSITWALTSTECLVQDAPGLLLIWGKHPSTMSLQREAEQSLLCSHCSAPSSSPFSVLQRPRFMAFGKRCARKGKDAVVVTAVRSGEAAFGSCPCC